VVAVDPLAADYVDNLRRSGVSCSRRLCSLEPGHRHPVAELLLRQRADAVGDRPEVSDGEFLGIVGPNAGGKSTLLKLIFGLLQPQSGSLRY
jgi:ABC-type uncharacterized transport system ATPase subunit